MLSICVPTYNRAKMLERFFKHLLTFNDLEFEVCVSNNGSSDDTESVIARYKEQFGAFKFQSCKETVPVLVNFDIAARLASGTYIILMADDDLPDEQGLFNAVQMFENDSSISSVYGGYDQYTLEDVRVGEHKLTSEVKSYSSQNALELLQAHFSLEVPMFRRDIYFRFRHMQANACPHAWAFLGYCLNKGKVLLTHFVYFKHYVHKERITERNAGDPAFLFNFLVDYETMLASLPVKLEMKAQLLLNFLVRGANFAAHKLIGNGKYLEARLFINRGFVYNPAVFRKLAIEWNDKYLFRAALQYIEQYVAARTFFERVVLLEGPNEDANQTAKEVLSANSALNLEVCDAETEFNYAEFSDDHVLVSLRNSESGLLKYNNMLNLLEIMSEMKYNIK